MICKCGHNRQNHLYRSEIDLKWTPCKVELGKEKYMTYYCLCLHFQADNLKYLEQKYEETIK